MLGNIAKNCLLLHSKNTLFKRYSASQVAHGIKNKWTSASIKDQSKALETEEDDQPIKYSTSKAANMRIDEYRDPQGDKYPEYQGIVISLSLIVFLGYFCILREENDIDLLFNTDLETVLSNAQKNMTEKEKLKPKL